MQPFFFNKPVHFIQQTRKPLHLIHNHPPTRLNGTTFAREVARIRQNSLVDLIG